MAAGGDLPLRIHRQSSVAAGGDLPLRIHRRSWRLGLGLRSLTVMGRRRWRTEPRSCAEISFVLANRWIRRSVRRRLAWIRGARGGRPARAAPGPGLRTAEALASSSTAYRSRTCSWVAGGAGKSGAWAVVRERQRRVGGRRCGEKLREGGRREAGQEA